MRMTVFVVLKLSTGRVTRIQVHLSPEKARETQAEWEKDGGKRSRPKAHPLSHVSVRECVIKP